MTLVSVEEQKTKAEVSGVGVGCKNYPRIFKMPPPVSHWAPQLLRKELQPRFSNQPSQAGLSNPLEEHFNQPPCLSLSWPLLSLSESVSIAGNPGTAHGDVSSPSQAERPQRAGLPTSPFYRENKQVWGSQGLWAWGEGSRQPAGSA